MLRSTHHHYCQNSQFLSSLLLSRNFIQLQRRRADSKEKLMASGKRLIQLGAESGIRLSKLGDINAGSTINRLGASAISHRSLCSNSSGNRLDYGQISPNGKRVYPVDNLAMVRSLEAHGIPSKHAEAITSAMSQVLRESLETVSQNLISNNKMQKILIAQEANFSKLTSEVQSSQKQGHLLKGEIEKLQNNIDKMRFEIAKVASGPYSNWNLERWSEKVADQIAGSTDQIKKLDVEINALRASQEAVKYDVFWYFMRALSAPAAGIGLICIINYLLQ